MNTSTAKYLIEKLEAAQAMTVSFTEHELIVELEDGRTISTPLAYYPRLDQGAPEERENWVIEGEGIHWPNLDEDIRTADLLIGLPSAESPRSLQKWLEGRKEKVLHETQAGYSIAKRPLTDHSFDEVLTMARRLHPIDQAKLVARLAPGIEHFLANLEKSSFSDERLVLPDTIDSPDSPQLEFMRLSISERQQILETQAKSMVSHYEQTATERDEWQSGDFIDEH